MRPSWCWFWLCPHAVLICRLNHLCLEQVPQLQHLIPFVIDEGQEKGRQVPSEKPIVWGSHGKGRDYKIQQDQECVGCCWRGLCLSWCFTLVLRLMDGWASRTALITRNTETIVCLPLSCLIFFFLDSGPFLTGEVKCWVTRSCLLAMSVRSGIRNPFPVPPLVPHPRQKSKNQMLE